MTQRNNHLRNTTHGPRTAARAVASRAPALRVSILGTLLVTALITVLVLITGPLSAEYGFV